jgi:tetratricopeptide (TPR) repeat protein
MLLRTILFFVILLFALFGYITYLNHEIPVTVFLLKGRPLTTSLPALVIISFASGALIVFLGSLARDLAAGWRELMRGRRLKREETVQAEIAKGLHWLLKGNGERAENHLNRALKMDPQNTDVCVKLSDAHASQGRLNEALEILDRAWGIDPENDEILLKKARLYNQMGNSPMAIDTFERVLARDASNRTALVDARDICLQQENWEKALRVQEDILKIIKNEGDGSREKSLYLGIKHECARSLIREATEASMERSLRLCREMIKQQRDFQPAYILMGEIYQKQRRWVEAARIFGRGFRLSKSAIFLLRLEDLYLKREDRKTLLKIYRRTIEKNPENTIFSYFYARLCLRLNMYDEAMDELVEIEKRRKGMAQLHGLMAQVLAAKGHLEEAIREYRTASELANSQRFPFRCRRCHRESTEWTARCPSCHEWNTYFLEGEDASTAGIQA